MNKELSESQEWILDENERLNKLVGEQSLKLREALEHLAESGREHFKLGNFQLAMKYKAVKARLED